MHRTGDGAGGGGEGRRRREGEDLVAQNVEEENDDLLLFDGQDGYVDGDGARRTWR